MAAGVPFDRVGTPIPVASLKRFDWQKAYLEGDIWHANIVYADRFGNLVTNLHVSMFTREFSTQSEANAAIGKYHLSLGDFDLGLLQRTFADVSPRMPLAYVGSSGFVEIAIRDGSAQDKLRYDEKTLVKLRKIS